MPKMLAVVLLILFSHVTPAQLIVADSFELKKFDLIPCTPVKDQNMSSTCWSFASNSFIESELLRMGKGEYDLSEMYTARMAYLQKIKTHLKTKGQNYFTPGGQFHDVQFVLKSYGMVPETVYNGKTNGETYHNHSQLDALMAKYINQLVAKGIKEPDANDWKYINGLFDKYLGKVPLSFIYKGKKYTPQSFLKNELEFDPDDYIELTSYTHHPYYSGFVLENKYNWSSSKYMNVPFADFIRITDEALKNGYSVIWNGDVDESTFHFSGSYAYLNPPYDIVKERQRTFEDSTSSLDHAMHITGLTTDNAGRRWYYIKNSWGTGNTSGGYILMDENYFSIKTAAIVVNKKGIPADIRLKMGLKN